MNDTLEFSDFGLYINSYRNDCLIESWQKNLENVRKCPKMSENVHVRFDIFRDIGHFGRAPPQIHCK